jgi:uncharacterized protein (DUF1684 family)
MNFAGAFFCCLPCTKKSAILAFIKMYQMGQKVFRLFFSVAAICLFCYSPMVAQPTTAAYNAELQQWSQQRVQFLKSEGGWLNLAGLLWLQPGINTIGTDSSQQLRLPEGTAPQKAGTIVWENKQVHLQGCSAAGFSIHEKPVTQALLFGPGIKPAPVVAIGSLRFTVIARGDKLGLRVRNLEHPALQHFAGLTRFDADTNFRVIARLVPAGPFQTITITNVLGQTSQQPSPGTLLFQLNNKPYSLQCMEEDGQLFIVFGDETNGESTYGAGRFVYAPFPDAQGNVLLDFNKAFNPPCAFTPFATCPLPPAPNQLPLAITAGEKFSAH